MGTIKQYINIGGRKFWAMFDTGARNTYLTKEASSHLPTFEMTVSNPVSLGGKTHLITRDCRLECTIKGYNVKSLAFVLDEICNDEDGKKIDILIGALLMQQWGIVCAPEKEDVDMSHYSKEFVEF